MAIDAIDKILSYFIATDTELISNTVHWFTDNLQF